MLFDWVMGTRVGWGRILKVAKASFQTWFKRTCAHALQKTKLKQKTSTCFVYLMISFHPNPPTVESISLSRGNLCFMLWTYLDDLSSIPRVSPTTGLNSKYGPFHALYKTSELSLIYFPTLPEKHTSQPFQSCVRLDRLFTFFFKGSHKCFSGFKSNNNRWSWLNKENKLASLVLILTSVMYASILLNLVQIGA